MWRNATGSPAVLAAVVCLAACDDPSGPSSGLDLEPPVVVITAPAEQDTVSGTVLVRAIATDDIGVAGVQFRLSGFPVGEEDTEPPYELSWNTWESANGPGSLSARARDMAGNQSTSVPHRVVVRNVGTVEVAVIVNGGTGDSGSDPDGIQVIVDGVFRGTVPGTGGLLPLSGLSRGTHRIELDGLSFNCEHELAMPIQVSIDGEGPTSVEVPVRCAEVGTARITVDVSGPGFDPDGFALLLDGDERATFPGIGGETAFDLVVGTYEARLEGLVGNCTFTSSGSAVLSVAPGETATAAFAINCERLLDQAVAFAAWGEQGTRDIFRTDFGRNGLVNLTDHPSDDFDPAWSPDGSRIAFVSDRDDPRGNIYLMNADGSNVTRISDGQAFDRLPVWSPDGSQIAFASDSSPAWGGYPDDPVVYLMNADGSERRQLSPGENAIRELPWGWSPDGSTIVVERFNLWSQTSDLYRISPDGSGFAPIGDVGGHGGPGASFSPDGQRIAFTLEEGDWYYGYYSDIVLINVDGSGRTRITSTDDAYERDPVWTSDGSRILFWDDGVGLSLMYADGSGRELILPGTGLRPTLSP
jgi:hypothetical protein